MKITFRQGGDNTLKCVNQLLDKMTLDVFNSLLKKEYVKPETDVYETLVSHLIMESAVNTGGTNDPINQDEESLEPDDAKIAVFDVEPEVVIEDDEEEDVLVWGLSWFKYMWQ